ncbi:uncharacterized protein VP01_1019g7 [Puccinia sorghi]|uniref:Uncharacterized protein n=1 Tax=Puccinia sorghi TaxID=27349 RepID=A0A0L6VUY5_9BASI|nr:uncharacterized protein VP01_1019g7 [Puccinia sorghi]
MNLYPFSRRNLWGLRHIIYPFKLLTVAFHELYLPCHSGKMHGGPHREHHARSERQGSSFAEGGLTKMRGGIRACTLPAGYLGSSLIGALLIFAGFDTVASKVNKILSFFTKICFIPICKAQKQLFSVADQVASIVLAVMLLITLWWARNWLTRVVVVMAIGMMVALWFIDHGSPLRFYVLFNGVMSCLYSVWDIVDDLVFRKVNESDASQFAALCPLIPSRVWGVIWLAYSLHATLLSPYNADSFTCASSRLLISLIFMLGGILAGLAAFKDSTSEQSAASKSEFPSKFFTHEDHSLILVCPSP